MNECTSYYKHSVLKCISSWSFHKEAENEVTQREPTKVAHRRRAQTPALMSLNIDPQVDAIFEKTMLEKQPIFQLYAHISGLFSEFAC